MTFNCYPSTKSSTMQTFLTAISFLLISNCFCQPKFLFSVDIGSDISLGNEEKRYKAGDKNPAINVVYMKNKHFAKPGLKIKLRGMYNINNKLGIGFQGGMISRSDEPLHGYNYSLVTFPLELTSTYALWKSNYKKLEAEISAGVNLYHLQIAQIKEYPSFTAAAGLLYRFNSIFFIRGGYEYQVNRGSMHIYADADPGSNEYIHFTFPRQLVYLSAGIVLFRCLEK